MKKFLFGTLLFLNVLSVSLFAARAKHRWILWFQDLRSAVESARKYRVPEPILFAMSYADTRFHLHREFSRIGWVRMQPWHPERAVTAAFLAEADASVFDVLRDPEMGLRATAQNLASKFDISGRDPDVLENWRVPLERWQGLTFPENEKAYADYILQLANKGFRGVEDHGHSIVVEGLKQSVKPFSAISQRRQKGFLGLTHLPYFDGSPLASPVLPPEKRTVTHIVIHSTETDFFTALDYFMRPTTRVGAHYLVRAHDGFSVQVSDERRAVFHDACFNDHSIGIEHEGYSERGSLWFSDEMYRASAKIVRQVAGRYGIPLDRKHILGHSEAPDCSDHEDPGTAWDWEKYMGYVHEG